MTNRNIILQVEGYGKMPLNEEGLKTELLQYIIPAIIHASQKNISFSVSISIDTGSAQEQTNGND